MRKLLLGTVALVALVGPAAAAEMRPPVYKAPPPVVPVWSWTGCFLGGHAGGVTVAARFHVETNAGGRALQSVRALHLRESALHAELNQRRIPSFSIKFL